MDLDQPAETKKRGKKGKKQAAAEEDEEEIIRCVCGAVTTEDDNGEAWIACDNCGVWQHNVCVGVSPFEDETPEKYLCEQCDVVFHKVLLDGIKRGEKPWEDRQRAHEIKQREEEEATKKGKGKKGKGNKRLSDQKSDLSHATNGKAKSPSTPVPEAKKGTPARGSGKRKDPPEKESAKVCRLKEQNLLYILNCFQASKIAKTVATPQAKSPPSDLPAAIKDLESSRQNVAKFLLKSIRPAIENAVSNNVYAYSMGDTAASKGERLSIQIEDAVYKTHPDRDSYGKQSRAIAFNIKNNQDLCNGLLTKSLLPSVLAVMATEDMATKEQKQQTAKMKAQSDKQSIMVTDDGPRIRRTHKGDEIIEGDNFAVPNDTSMTSSRRRSMMDPNAEMATRSRENSPGNDVELPENIDDHRSRDDIRSHVIPKQPLNIETKAKPPVRKQSTQGDFDFQKIISSVPGQSPTTPSHLRRPSGNAPPSNGPGVDPDIDRMLQDDEGNESPPYSPAEYDSDPEIIWRGMVTMDSIAKFPAVAKHVGGADLTRIPNPIPWSDILQKDLRIAGRIDHDKANEYLCSLRYSPSTDLVVVNVTPTGETASQGFQEMFDYFASKNRFGVLTNKGRGNIRDTYLVPVPVSPGQMPDFITNLEGHRVPDNRTEPMLLVALVIRNDYATQHGFDGVADAQSPSLQHPHVRQMSMSGAGPAMSPIAPQNSSFAAVQPPQPHLSQDDLARRQQQEQAQRQGEDTAKRILGEYVNAPTVGFLMPQAFQMRSLEWDVIRGILESDERARQDLQHLSQVLEVRMAAQGNQNAQPGGPVQLAQASPGA